MSPSWVLRDLLASPASLEPPGLDDLVLAGPLALLDPQDLCLRMDRVCGERRRVSILKVCLRVLKMYF